MYLHLHTTCKGTNYNPIIKRKSGIFLKIRGWDRKDGENGEEWDRWGRWDEWGR